MRISDRALSGDVPQAWVWRCSRGHVLSAETIELLLFMDFCVFQEYVKCAAHRGDEAAPAI